MVVVEMGTISGSLWNGDGDGDGDGMGEQEGGRGWRGKTYGCMGVLTMCFVGRS